MATLSNGRKLYNHSKWRAISVCLRTRLPISVSPEPKAEEALHDRASFLSIHILPFIVPLLVGAATAKPGEAPM
jgi:hypothetical protein